jgi:hypothetical protein
MHDTTSTTAVEPIEVRFRIADGRFTIEDLPIAILDVLIDAIHDGHTGLYGHVDGLMHDLVGGLYAVQGQRVIDGDYGTDDERREWVIELGPDGYSGRYQTEYGHTPEVPREVTR